jgi:hypothetical protein
MQHVVENISTRISSFIKTCKTSVAYQYIQQLEIILKNLKLDYWAKCTLVINMLKLIHLCVTWMNTPTI